MKKETEDSIVATTSEEGLIRSDLIQLMPSLIASLATSGSAAILMTLRDGQLELLAVDGSNFYVREEKITH